MANELTRYEKSLLRQLASEAWEAELTHELEELFERFCIWADNGISAFDLSQWRFPRTLQMLRGTSSRERSCKSNCAGHAQRGIVRARASGKIAHLNRSLPRLS